jgi:hypothetical protein
MDNNMKIPKTLDEAIEIIINDNQNNPKFEELIKLSEQKALAELHFTTGRNIRNDWKLWNEESDLHKYFKNLGIFHADDMSGIILTSVHRKINNQPIDLENQMEFYKTYWKKYKD